MRGARWLIAIFCFVSALVSLFHLQLEGFGILLLFGALFLPKPKRAKGTE